MQILSFLLQKFGLQQLPHKSSEIISNPSENTKSPELDTTVNLSYPFYLLSRAPR